MTFPLDTDDVAGLGPRVYTGFSAPGSCCTTHRAPVDPPRPEFLLSEPENAFPIIVVRLGERS
jgi:hypothetical protein